MPRILARSPRRLLELSQRRHFGLIERRHPALELPAERRALGGIERKLLLHAGGVVGHRLLALGPPRVLRPGLRALRLDLPAEQLLRLTERRHAVRQGRLRQRGPLPSQLGVPPGEGGQPAILERRTGLLQELGEERTAEAAAG